MSLARALTLCALLIAPARAEASAIGDLVAKAVDAYGGAAALSAIVAVEQKGEVHAKIRHAGQSGRMTRIFQPPERLRVEIAYPDGETETRILDGERAWRRGEPVRGPRRDAMLGQSLRLALPLLLREHEDELVDRGEVRRDGRTLRALALPRSGSTLTVEIDPASGLIVRSRFQIPMGPGAAMEFATDYADFREVGPLRFAYRERSYAQGQHTADTELSSVELLDAAPAGSFEP